MARTQTKKKALHKPLSIRDFFMPWELPAGTLVELGAAENPPIAELPQVIDAIMKRFEDPKSLPAPLAQVFVLDDAPHSGQWSPMNRFIVALHGHREAMGFQQWKAHGRFVKKGEKSFYILAPMTFNKVIERKEESTDQTATEIITIVSGFRGVPVFGLDQTEGKPYPMPDPSFLDKLPFADVAAKWNLKLSIYSGERASALGFYSPRESLISMGVENAATFCHELIHAADDRLGALVLQKYTSSKTAKRDAEIVAELGGAVLLAAIGMENEADLGGCYEYLKFQAKTESPAEVKTAVFRVLDRTLRAVALVVDTAREIEGTLAGTPAI